MQKTSRLNRLLAVLVAVFMAVCCLPLQAFAADETYLVDFVFHVGNNVGGEYLDDWEKKGVEVEACNGLTLTELLKKASVPVPEGYELAAPDQKYDINAKCTIDVEVKKTETKPEEPAASRKLVHVTFAIDDSDKHGTFADGQTYLNWTWDDMNATITSAPEVIAEDGYRLAGWRIQGASTEYLDAGAFGVDPNLAAFSPSTTEGYDEEGYMTIYPVFEKTEEEPAAPRKLVHVTFAIDDGDKHGTFADGQTYLNWKWDDMNTTITSAPEVIAEDGYRLAGWRIQGASTEYLDADAFGVDPNLAAFSPSTTEGYDEEGYMTIYPVFVKNEEETPVVERKMVEVTFAIDDNDKHGTFVDGQTYLNWKWEDMNEVITSAPEVIAEDGYRLAGWRIQGASTEYLNADAFGIDPNLAFFAEGDSIGYMTIYPVFVKLPEAGKIGLNYWDIENNEQVAEGSVDVADVTGDKINTSTFTDIPDGYELVWTGDLQINDGWVWVEVRPTKTLRIYWAIDNGDAADFADGSADTWTQELTWKHIHDEIALPQITVADGYVFNGWSVSGQNGEFWGPELKTMTVGDKFVADEKGGVISITANIVTREAGQGGSTGGNNGGSTGSSEQSGATAAAASAGNDTVVKTAAPADNSVKIMPQTGFTAEAPAVFGGMLFAAMAGAGAYLFAMRKKLNETF